MSKEKIPKRDFIIAKPVEISGSSVKMSFSKDSTAISRQSLRAKVRMTYAGLRTKNRAVYLPGEHFKSAHTFLTPYNKPVQVHHQDHVDPIGRVVDVRYVDTTAAAAVIDSRVKQGMLGLQDERSGILDKLKSANLFLELSQNPDYKGVGHILGLWDISDPDAIQKMLDGRYLTVSTGMMPKHAYCNICALEGQITDWSTDFCEHDRGRIYDGLECVAIPTDYEWEEVSPVNHPAAPLSQVIEVGQGLSLTDMTKTDLIESGPQQVFEDFYLMTQGSSTALRIRDGIKVDIPKFNDKNYSQNNSNELSSLGDNDSKLVEGQRSEDLIVNNSDENLVNSVIGEERNPHMEVTGKMAHELTVLSEDTVSSYTAVAENLKDGVVRLTNEQLESLEDSAFIGPNRTFPVVNMDHADAIRSLLEKTEDCEAKETLLKFLDEQVETLTTEAAENTETETGESTEATKVTTGTETSTTAVTETKTNTETTGETTETTGDTTTEEANETATTTGDTTGTEVEASESTETETATTGSDEISKELTLTQDELRNVTLDRDIWKTRCARLEDEIKQVALINSSLVKDQKKLLAESLVEAQSSRGFSIEDSTKAVESYSNRSIQSLRDSLSDLRAKTVEGTARVTNGERVADPRRSDSVEGKDVIEETVVDSQRSDFDGILERYWNLYYGPGGQKAAGNFLDSVKRNGIVPLTLQP
jgi:hypothetical protein